MSDAAALNLLRERLQKALAETNKADIEIDLDTADVGQTILALLDALQQLMRAYIAAAERSDE